jgi:hypothetical protein
LGHELRDLVFCTLMRTPSAISSVMKVSPTSVTLPRVPARHHLIAGGELGEQVLVFSLGALLLRTKRQEVEDDEEHAHHQKRRELAQATGAACAQASEIKPFMCVVRAAKRAALCHSVGLAPGC